MPSWRRLALLATFFNSLRGHPLDRVNRSSGLKNVTLVKRLITTAMSQARSDIVRRRNLNTLLSQLSTVWVGNQPN